MSSLEITSKHLLSKMEELILKAKQEPSEEKLRGYIIAIQALCEVMVNENPSISSLNIKIPEKQVGLAQTIPSVPMSEPIQMDEANGNSIFDF